MKKYFQLILLNMKMYTVFRLNFILWRAQSMVNVLVNYFLWWTIFQYNRNVFGYQESTILTYVLVSSILSGIVLSSRTRDVPAEIRGGQLSNFLLRPFNYFYYIGIRDISDKLLNTFCSGIELIVLFSILQPQIFIQTNASLILLFILAVVLSTILYFPLSILIGFIGFWSSEVWAPRFILMMVIQFFSGFFFPIDVLPKFLYQLLMLTPIPYLVFFPMKVYLGQLNSSMVISGFIMMSGWSIALYILMHKTWQRGLIVYGAEGR